MRIVFISHESDRAAWLREIRAADPSIDLCEPGDIKDPGSVLYAIAGRTKPGDLAAYPNLRVILSMWAGVEHLLSDPTIPPHIPIVRMVEPSLTRGMIEYICCHVLNILLRTGEYPVGEWRHPQRTEPRFAPDLRVGVMGLGVLGSACAESLVQLGFPVSGWSRRAKSVPGVTGFHGAESLDAFLAESDVLVLLLPHTPDTRNILGRRALECLPTGAAVINAGRGELIDDEALLQALDSGRLSRAVLDVFRTEPLPPDHPFWSNPRVTVTPHVASVTNPRTAAPVLVENLGRLERGETVSPIVDRKHGY